MKTRSKFFILLLDNFSSDGSIEGIYELGLSNTTVIFLPPNNTTSFIRKCDAGIIAAENFPYRRWHIFVVLDHIYIGNDDIYIVDSFQGMRCTNNS